MREIKAALLVWAMALSCLHAIAQSSQISGRVTNSNGKSVEGATVFIPELNTNGITDSMGYYHLEDIRMGNWLLEVRFMGFNSYNIVIDVKSETIQHDVILTDIDRTLNEVVISGTMKEVLKSESPVPVEIYASKFFRANPTPSLFEALQNINGVHPQVNCSVCNTGDIHINGLEGPYTMILIDGM